MDYNEAAAMGRVDDDMKDNTGTTKDNTGEDEEVGGLDDGPNDPTHLCLISNEESPAKFKVPFKQAMMCKLVATAYENDKDEKDVVLKKVDGETLRLIVEYLKVNGGEKFPEIGKPINSVDMTKVKTETGVLAQKYVDYISKPKKDIFAVILGANYMDNKGLLHLGCAKIATLIKGKSPEEIKRILGDDDAENATSRRLLEALKSF